MVLLIIAGVIRFVPLFIMSTMKHYKDVTMYHILYGDHPIEVVKCESIYYVPTHALFMASGTNKIYTATGSEGTKIRYNSFHAGRQMVTINSALKYMASYPPLSIDKMKKHKKYKYDYDVIKGYPLYTSSAMITRGSKRLYSQITEETTKDKSSSPSNTSSITFTTSTTSFTIKDNSPITPDTPIIKESSTLISIDGIEMIICNTSQFKYWIVAGDVFARLPYTKIIYCQYKDIIPREEVDAMPSIGSHSTLLELNSTMDILTKMINDGVLVESAGVILSILNRLKATVM